MTTNSLLPENRMTVNQLAREQGVTPNSAWRWIIRGIKGHVLPSFHVGGRRFVSRDDFAAWIAAINGEPVKSGARTRRQRERDTERKLQEAGLTA